MRQNMKYILQIFFFSLGISANAQRTVYVGEQCTSDQKTYVISDEATFPDIKIQLGKRISFPDLKVKLTPYENQANIILQTSSMDANTCVQVDNCTRFPDVTIIYGENISFPDYKIQIDPFESFPDVTVYSEKVLISEAELIASLLHLLR